MTTLTTITFGSKKHLTNYEDSTYHMITTMNGQQFYLGNTSRIPSKTIYSNITDLPQQWQDIYQQKMTPIKDQKPLLTPITNHELTETLKSLPNNKAAGPNGLTYEIWKKFPKTYHNIILTLFNDILATQIIPSKWQEALLYPIPKLEYWNCDLSKIRPIILLDTFRKIFSKIITNRL
ncbi:tbingi protein [Rhizophagus clarus]|uniref:Tbingi protein n=1 Tax=Rhizophagus clarus TaxID=94130 RepID=A0A8H3QAJ6_9GLOM|nr:tbingi protein [Rhizophagus clarus]